MSTITDSPAGLVVGLLDEILKNVQAGKAVSIVPEHQQLTTQRAAKGLGCRPRRLPSRPRFVVKAHGAFRNQGLELKGVLGVLLGEGKRYMIMRGLGRRQTAPIPRLN